MENTITASKEVTVDNDKSNQQQQQQPITDPVSAQNELQQLASIITNWKEVGGELKTLNEQVREKRKRLKVMEEMILRIMKKHNIGALDLKSSGGRILYRRSSSKSGLNEKILFSLLSQHMKSETAAADAIKYITEHREAKTKESLRYEKE